jgi:hypothetical protein
MSAQLNRAVCRRQPPTEFKRPMAPVRGHTKTSQRCNLSFLGWFYIGSVSALARRTWRKIPMQRLLMLALACAALLGGIATTATAQRGYGSSAADLSREVNGIPCGMNCTARHHYQWAHHSYRHHNWNAYYPPRR